MYERRLQILIDDARYQRLAAAARDRRQSVSAAIRDAIDVAFPSDLAKKRAAWERLKKAPRMPVPDTVEQLKAELDEIRGGGL